MRPRPVFSGSEAEGRDDRPKSGCLFLVRHKVKAGRRAAPGGGRAGAGHERQSALPGRAQEQRQGPAGTFTGASCWRRHPCLPRCGEEQDATFFMNGRRAKGWRVMRGEGLLRHECRGAARASPTPPRTLQASPPPPSPSLTPCPQPPTCRPGGEGADPER